MGVRILSDGENAAIYCSVTDVAFGPVFYGSDEHDAFERAEAFLDYLPLDARKYTDSELQTKYCEFVDGEAAYWKAKEELEKAMLDDE